MVKWKIDYLERLRTFSNEELLDEYTDLAGGDDYDGCYTERGEWQYIEVEKELRKRLTEIGFLLQP